MPADGREYLTPAEFAALLRVPERTVAGLCARAALPGAYRVGSRWRICLAEFKAGARSVPPVRLARRGLPADLLARCAESVV